MNEETLKNDLRLFKVRATNVMADFFVEWQSSFVDDSICFNETQINVTSINARIYTLSVNIIDVKTLAKTQVIVTGNLDHDEEIYHRYTIKLMVYSDKINNFKRPYFDPYLLADGFKRLYTTIFNYDIIDNSFDSFSITFDESANVLSVRLFFIILKNNMDYQSERLIYEAEDVSFLQNSNLTCWDFSHYCKFKFLCECTTIRNIIDEQDLIKSYKEYIQNMDSYHTLLQMKMI